MELNDLNYSTNSRKTYERLYLARDNNDSITESIGSGCHHRVAQNLAEDSTEYINFKRMLDEQIFRPNTPCMANIGIKKNPMLLACFVLGLEDDMDSIIEMWGTAAKIYEGGGGAGIPITNLRRKGAPLTSGGEASGPLSYLNVIETVSDTVKSGGKNRRAANLVAARFDHPDIVDIINCKRNKESYKSMNLSVSVTNSFMELITKKGVPEDAVVSEGRFAQYDPKEGFLGYERAEKIWDEILQAAWECADPGLLFLDNVNADNPLADLYGGIETTNPCGEVGLWPWSACDLGHLNLMKYVMVEASGEVKFDWTSFETDIYWAVLFLNRIIENTSFPNEKFKKMMLETRPIGLGLMGLAGMLFKMGIPYGSRESINLWHQITEFLTKHAFEASSTWVLEGKLPEIELNGKHRSRFAEWVSKYAPSFKTNDVLPANVTVTCLAPTGSTAISADTDFSFEPKFALYWVKQLDGGGTMEFLDENFKQALRDEGFIKERLDEITEALKETKGSVNSSYIELPQRIKEVFVTAHDISIEARLQMQAAAQKNITMAVSSTVNLPQSATKQDIHDVYLKAWEYGLKGITVYRDGCLDEQPVSFGGSSAVGETVVGGPGSEDEKVANEAVEKYSEKFTPNKNCFDKNYKRPMEREGKVVEVSTPAGKMYVRGSFDCGYPMEVFIDLGAQGSRENVLLNGLGRVISRALQRGVGLEDITDTLRGSGGDTFFLKLNGWEKSVRVDGVLDAVATILDECFSIPEIEEENWPEPLVSQNEEDTDLLDEAAKEETPKKRVPGKGECADRCPECGKFTIRKDVGCRDGICTSCGFSNCS